MTRTELISGFEKVGYDLTIGENYVGRLTACAKRKPKNGEYVKPTFNYWYRSEEHLLSSVEGYLKNITDRISEKEARKERKKEARATLVNPFKVGDVLYDSWGYDQTNIDFYEIVEVGKKSVVMREIGSEIVNATGPMSANVKPVPGKYVSEPIKKILVVSVGYNGENASYHIKSRHGWISKYDKGENGVYSSWYH